MTPPRPESDRALQQPPSTARRGRKGKPVRFIHYGNVAVDDEDVHKPTPKRNTAVAKTAGNEAPTHRFVHQSGTKAVHPQSSSHLDSSEPDAQAQFFSGSRGAKALPSQALVPHSRSRGPDVLSTELQAKHPLPWAQSYPDTVDFYNHNSPDYSGMRLYDERSIHPEGHKRLLRESPLDFTMQVMLSERARHDGQDRRLDHIKTWSMRSINGILQRAVGDKALLALTPVGALAFYDAVHEEHCGSAGIHLSGVQALLARFGPIDKQNFHTACLIRYADALHAYYQQKPRVIERRSTRVDVVDGIHALRLALQPTKSGLSEHRLKIHLAMSYGSPATYMFFTLWRLDNLAATLLDHGPTPPSMTPAEARVAVETMLTSAATFASWRNELPGYMYSEEDQRNHRDTFTLIHLSTLVLIHKMARIVNGSTAKAEADLDHHVQKSLMHLLWPKLGVRSPQAMLWALFVAAPFLEKTAVLKQVVTPHIAKLCQKLDLGSWQQVRAFLGNIYFCAPLQEEACADYWSDVQAVLSERQAEFRIAARRRLASEAGNSRRCLFKQDSGQIIDNLGARIGLWRQDRKEAGFGPGEHC